MLHILNQLGFPPGVFLLRQLSKKCRILTKQLTNDVLITEDFGLSGKPPLNVTGRGLSVSLASFNF